MNKALARYSTGLEHFSSQCFGIQRVIWITGYKQILKWVSGWMVRQTDGRTRRTKLFSYGLFIFEICRKRIETQQEQKNPPPKRQL